MAVVFTKQSGDTYASVGIAASYFADPRTFQIQGMDIK
jgi:hypothetical protein